MEKSRVAQTSEQPSSGGQGVALYNLTGNAPSQPMSTREYELRKKRKKRLLQLARQCSRISNTISLIRVAFKL